MVMDSRKSPVNDPRKSPINFVKNMVKGRRTSTREADNASIDIFCDESTQPNIKSVRPNSSRRTNSPVVMEGKAPESPVKQRSKRIERTKQRVVEAKSRDRTSERSQFTHQDETWQFYSIRSSRSDPCTSCSCCGNQKDEIKVSLEIQ